MQQVVQLLRGRGRESRVLVVSKCPVAQKNGDTNACARVPCSMTVRTKKENDLLAGSPTAPSPLMSGSVPGVLFATTLKETTARWHQHNALSRPQKMQCSRLSDRQNIFCLAGCELCRWRNRVTRKYSELLPLELCQRFGQRTDLPTVHGIC